MFPKPRQIDSESALYDAAIKILMRRAHSVHEMKQALERRCEDAALVKNVMARLKQAALEESARQTDEAALVRQRIERKLRSLRSPESERSAHLESERGSHLGVGGKGANLDDKKFAALYRSLLRAGFSADIVRRELRSITREDVPEVDADSDNSAI